MKKTIIIGSFSFLLGACSPQVTQTEAPESSQPVQEEVSEATSEASGAAQTNTFSLAEVAEHNVEADCWLAIDGGVYDVTGFIASGNHGGGDAILEGCGKDATELFDTRPMGSGTPHSSKARGFLQGFKIGDLAQ